MKIPVSGIISSVVLLITCLVFSPKALAWGNWGYVAINGKEVIAPKYLTAAPFQHGFAKVYRSNDPANAVFINKSGDEFIVPAKINNDPGLVTKYKCQGKVIEQNNFDQVLDTRGEFILLKTPYEFMVANRRYPQRALRNICVTGFGTNAFNGKIWLAVSGRYYEFTGAPDKSDIEGFETVSNPEVHNDAYEYIGEFADGVAPALSKNGYWSYINGSMETVIALPMNCCYASSFHEGLASVAVGGRKPCPSTDGRPPFGPFPGAQFGFIDRKGRVAIDVQYPCPPRSNDSNYGIFKDGYALATAKKNESIAYGYIDRTGRFVIPPIYASLGELREGMVAFSSEPIGFSKSNNRVSFENQLLQFFKQFAYIGMNKQELHSLLGNPTYEHYSPKAECFLISSGCLGSTSLAVQFDDKHHAIAYSIGSFGSWSSPFTNELQPSVWITAPNKPEPGEDLYDFFNRAATTYYTAPYLVPKDTLILRQLDNVFTRPDANQQKFSSESWQRERERRTSMLFALYHLNIDGKSPEQLQEILGKADRTTEVNDHHLPSQYYDLNVGDYDKVELECQFSNNHLTTIGLVANNTSGFSNEKNSKWILKNPSEQDVARDFNAYHALVGYPFEHVDRITGHPELVPNSDEKLYKIGDRLQIKSTGQKGYVTAFRIQTKVFSSNEKQKPHLSDWETINYRPDDPGYYSMGRIPFSDEIEKYLVSPFGSPFDKMRWSYEPVQRKYMMFDLIHEYHLIGRHRDEITSLLGKPRFMQSDRQDPLDTTGIKNPNESDSLTKNCLWYQLDPSEDAADYLQIALKNNKVVAFRLATVPNVETDHFGKQLTFTHYF